MEVSSWSVQVSNLFAPIQTVGLVTDGVPPAVYHLGCEGFVATSTGNSFQILNIKKLHVVLRSPILSHSISAIAASRASKGRVFVALEGVNEIAIFDRITEIKRLANGHRSQIIGMSVVGSLLVSWSKSEVLLWDLETFTLSGKLNTLQDKDVGEISCVIHPHTYLNKILVAYRCGGELQLWNIRTFKKIHSFRSVQPKSGFSDLSTGITALSLTIHPDVIGIGYSSGMVRLLDIQKDQVLCELQHAVEQGAVRTLTYRNDMNCITPGAIVSGCENGDIVAWDTKESRMLHMVEAAHQPECGVSLLQCLSNEPLMISSGADNSLIVWIFDGAEERPRILRQRQGTIYVFPDSVKVFRLSSSFSIVLHVFS